MNDSSAATPSPLHFCLTYANNQNFFLKCLFCHLVLTLGICTNPVGFLLLNSRTIPLPLVSVLEKSVDYVNSYFPITLKVCSHYNLYWRKIITFSPPTVSPLPWPHVFIKFLNLNSIIKHRISSILLSNPQSCCLWEHFHWRSSCLLLRSVIILLSRIRWNLYYRTRHIISIW